MITPEEFKNNVKLWGKKIGIEAREIHLRKMKRKWASCSNKGRLTFDPEILGIPPDELDEKIVHELLHIRYPNHGKMFKFMYKVYLKKI